MKTQQLTTTQENRPSKTKKHSFPGISIGTPKVPFRQCKKTVQQHELLSDWEDASWFCNILSFQIISSDA